MTINEVPEELRHLFGAGGLRAVAEQRRESEERTDRDFQLYCQTVIETYLQAKGLALTGS